MGKTAWLLVRYLSLPLTVIGIGGIAIAMATVYFSIGWLEPAFPLLIWSSAGGSIGALCCMIGANFIRCKNCGNRALVVPNTDSEPGNTLAIYDAHACHHCGGRLFS